MAQEKNGIVGGVLFPHAPIMVGAGACKTPAQTKEWLQIAAVVSGSYSMEPRQGNLGDTLIYPDTWEEVMATEYFLNTLELPNPGVHGSMAELSRLTSDNSLIVSIVGTIVADYVQAIYLFDSVQNIAALELNFGCPTASESIISFEIQFMEEVLAKCSDVTKPIWVKLSPFIGGNSHLLDQVSDMINASGHVSAVVACNTLPAPTHIDVSKLSKGTGTPGLSGPYMKPIVLSQVEQFRSQLDSRISVIASGGATTGNDVVDFLRAGAGGVQLTTLPYLNSPRDFWDLLLDEDTGSNLSAWLEN